MNFVGIEKAAPLDHWRPRYRWASQHTHSGHRPQMALLGLAENVEPVYLVGASNSGFTDPLQMTGISLQIATQAMLLTAPRLDYLVVARILADLADEVGPLAMSLEEQTLKAARAGSPRPKRQEEAQSAAHAACSAATPRRDSREGFCAMADRTGRGQPVPVVHALIRGAA
jgi:hypothetical protein